MNVCVVGLWHLGSVTAACLAARGHDVVGLDFEPTVVMKLAAGIPPVSEPGLPQMVKDALADRKLAFTCDAAQAVSHADAVWINFDTPVDEDDRANVEEVVRQTYRVFPHIRTGALLMVSSQLPVGTTAKLEEMFRREANGRQVSFAYVPENLRLGKAIEVFMNPDRVIVGLRSEVDRDKVIELFEPITKHIEWMSVESAEMTKHALNAFLATSVAFINEIGAVCEQVGADANEVARGLKSESRIGPRAYLSPGAAFAGGTLARDVVFLSQLGETHRVATHLLSSVKTSNDAHRRWAERRLEQLLGGIAGKTVAVWGLTYKPGTDTLRRSSSVELCEWLIQQGAVVRAYDPAVKALPVELGRRIELTQTALDAVQQASALVIATSWPEYRQISANEVATRMNGTLILDANRFLCDSLGNSPSLKYVSVGAAQA